jgi:hypothetical protein
LSIGLGNDPNGQASVTLLPSIAMVSNGALPPADSLRSTAVATGTTAPSVPKRSAVLTGVQELPRRTRIGRADCIIVSVPSGLA